MSQSTEIVRPVIMTARTHVGRVRTNNEDTLRCDPVAGIALLADGMGGLAAGEVASGMAVDVVYRQLLAVGGEGGGVAVDDDGLRAAVRRADRDIQLAAVARRLEMGTTLVAWCRTAGGARVAHVGDSRCYLQQQQGIRQLTRDHSVVQQRVDAGLLTQSEAWRAPDRHLITQALGLGGPLEIDVCTVPCQSGDRFLLCSDGLTDMVDRQTLHALLLADDDDATLADTLVSSALEGGGRDNISLIIVRV